MPTARMTLLLPCNAISPKLRLTFPAPMTPHARKSQNSFPCDDLPPPKQLIFMQKYFVLVIQAYLLSPKERHVRYTSASHNRSRRTRKKNRDLTTNAKILRCHHRHGGGLVRGGEWHSCGGEKSDDWGCDIHWGCQVWDFRIGNWNLLRICFGVARRAGLSLVKNVLIHKWLTRVSLDAKLSGNCEKKIGHKII